MHDLIIRNARIADGLGNPLIEGDLAVANGRVAAIGRIRDDAMETIDAGGQVLAPGVIDLHTHYDAQLTWDKTASPSPALGVTTVVIGNCGFGIAPTPAHRRDTVLANLSEVEAMSLAPVPFNKSLAREICSDVSQCTDSKVPPFLTKPS